MGKSQAEVSRVVSCCVVLYTCPPHPCGQLEFLACDAMRCDANQIAGQGKAVAMELFSTVGEGAIMLHRGLPHSRRSGFNGISWKTPGISRDLTGSPIISRNLTQSHGISRNLPQSPAISWNLMESHGLSRNLTEFNGISRRS